MITDGKKWHYLAVRSLPVLLRRITSNHHGDFYCLNCFHSYRTNNKLKKHEIVCNNHDYTIIIMRKVIESSVCNLCGFGCLLKKVRSCQNNPKNSYTEKKAKHKTSGYAWCSICSFDETKNRAIFIGEKIVWKNLSLKNLTYREADLLLHASLSLHRKI